MTNPVSIKEEELIRQCIQEDQKSLEAFYRMYAGKMMGICLRYAKNREDAEDILQEGFIKVFNNLKNFKKEGSLEGWVKRIMVNTALLHYRKTAKFENHVEVEAADKETNDLDILSSLSAKELMAQIQTLPDGYRMVFNMYVLEGYQHKEIGELLGINEGTSKSQLARARKFLMDIIKKREL